MIDRILPVIHDTGDYLTALSLYKADAPLTKEEADKLVAIYQKYDEGLEDAALAKLCIALDLLPGRTEEDAADFYGLELPVADLNVLFQVKDIISGQLELTAGNANQVVEVVKSGKLTRPVDIILARTALDVMAGAWNFGGLREQTQALAEFLSGLGTEELDKYSTIVEEARIKCRS